MKYLVAQDWPGNVRQLENVCHWLTVMAPGQTVEVGDLPPELREDAAARRRGRLDRGARARGREVADARRVEHHGRRSRASSRRR